LRNANFGKVKAMRKFSTLFLLIPLALLTGLYFFFSYTNGGICLKTPTCTEDVQTLCHPKREGIWQGPSLCSCGLDAATLGKRGWSECVVPEGYQGRLYTRETLSQLPIPKIPKTLPLFVVPAISLIMGIGALLGLWFKRQ